MIVGLRGTLRARGTDHAVLDVGGVFYKVFMPGTALSDLPPEGEPVTLHTHLYVREDQMSLYGTREAEQMTMFETLLGVTGVGPKMALAILGTLPVDTLQSAIANGDLTLLSRAPGVGKRLAQRMVLELKGKLDLSSIPGGGPALAGPTAEVADALTALGYSASEVTAALQKLPRDSDLDTGDLIRVALQSLGR